MNAKRRKREQTKVCKVVLRKPSGRLISCTRAAQSCTYEPGKTTKPLKGSGPLAAFTLLSEALSFVKSLLDPPYQIWQASGVVSRHRTVWSYYKKDKTYRPGYSSLPNGTILCDEILLLPGARRA